MMKRSADGLHCLPIGKKGYCLDVDNKCHDMIKGNTKPCKAGFICMPVGCWPIGFCIAA